MIGLVGRSVRDGLAAGVRLWPWTLGLLVLQLASGIVGVLHLGRFEPVAAEAIPIVDTLLGTWIAFRFYCHYYGVTLASRTVPDVIRRFYGWSVFFAVLGLVQAGGALLRVPAAINLVLVFGAFYFQLRLVALLPAVVAWPRWPGVDRIWNASGRLTLQLAGLFLVCFLVILLAVGGLMAVKGTHWTLGVLNMPVMMLWFEGHRWQIVAGNTVFATLLHLVGYAFRVNCLAMIAPDVPDGARRV